MSHVSYMFAKVTSQLSFPKNGHAISICISGFQDVFLVEGPFGSLEGWKVIISKARRTEELEAAWPRTWVQSRVTGQAALQVIG